MPTYIVLLRGINIGSNKRIKMERLAASCGALGFSNAKTYIQSGNIVLDAPKLSAAALSKKLEAKIVADFGFSADVTVRTKEELEQIVAGNPLLNDRRIDSRMLHVAFLADAPAPSAVKRLESLTAPPDLVRAAAKEIYFYFPNGVSKSSLWKHPLDKVLGVSATMRNWKTVNALHAMAQG
jgi:uncharacterized protein (DUF1697 family)